MVVAGGTVVCEVLGVVAVGLSVGCWLEGSGAVVGSGPSVEVGSVVKEVLVVTGGSDGDGEVGSADVGEVPLLS